MTIVYAGVCIFGFTKIIMIMKTKVISEVKSIDWSKVNLVRSNNTDLVVLTTGSYADCFFSGIALVSDGINNVGDESSRWIKDSFTLIIEPFTIEFNSK